MTETVTTSVSIDSLNLSAKCESAFEFEYVDTDGKDTGIFITVLGSQAPTVQEWIRKSLNRRRAQEAIQAKRGKEVERTVEDDEEFGNEAAAVRIVGWRGITQEFSHELAVRLVTNNSEIRAQVFKASNDLSNFTKG
ncbi:MAG: hypothetical protein ABI351_11970 [Herbaspirillum sp.]